MSNQLSIETQIKRAVEILKKGGIVAYPTDTVYGIGADPFNEAAVERIFAVKKRSKDLALPILLADKSDISRVAVNIPEIAWKLAECFFPGQLTMVLQKSPQIPMIVCAGGNTIAIRVPDYPMTVALIRGLGNPIIGTSANISGKPNPTTAEEVYQQLGDEVDFIIDGGEYPGGVESTVIDLSVKVPTILREGAVPLDVIAKACGFHIRRGS